MNLVLVHNGEDPVEFDQSLSDKTNIGIIHRKIRRIEEAYNCKTRVFIVYILQEAILKSQEKAIEEKDNNLKKKDKTIEKKDKTIEEKDKTIEKLMSLIPKQHKNQALAIIQENPIIQETPEKKPLKGILKRSISKLFGEMTLEEKKVVLEEKKELGKKKSRKNLKK